MKHEFLWGKRNPNAEQIAISNRVMKRMDEPVFNTPADLLQKGVIFKRPDPKDLQKWEGLETDWVES